MSSLNAQNTVPDVPSHLSFGPELVSIINDRLRRLSGAADRTRTQVSTLIQTITSAAADVVSGPHSNRLLLPGAGAGIAFYETDRTVVYVDGFFAGGVYSGIWANRPADLGANDAGFRFWSTDRTVLYRWSGSAWIYDSGTRFDTLANITTGLGANDAGYLFHATDYAHTLRWTGAAWQWAPGEDRSGQIGWWVEDPGTGWRFCNGGTATRLKADGTTEVVNIPDISANCFPKGATAYTGTAVAAVAPGISGSVAAEATHTHTTDVSGVTVSTAADHTHAIDHDHPAAASGGPSNTYTAVVGGAFFAADGLHTHQVDIPSLTATSGNGGTHAHTLSGSPASSAGSSHAHGVGTLAVDATGTPKYMALLPYYRL